MNSGTTALSFDGTEIWFTDTGGPGPVTVLLHGLTMTSRSNFEVCYTTGVDGKIAPGERPSVSLLLRDAGGRVIGIDARGHGRSGRSDDPDRYRGDSHALDVVAVLDTIGASDAHVVGYSMGSTTALRLALIDSRIRSLALAGTGPNCVEGVSPEWRAEFEAVGNCFVTNSWNEHPDLKFFRACARLDETHDFASLGAAAFGLEPIAADSPARIAVPVLVLNGGADNGDDDAARLAAMIPGRRQPWSAPAITARRVAIASFRTSC